MNEYPEVNGWKVIYKGENKIPDPGGKALKEQFDDAMNKFVFDGVMDSIPKSVVSISTVDGLKVYIDGVYNEDLTQKLTSNTRTFQSAEIFGFGQSDTVNLCHVYSQSESIYSKILSFFKSLLNC